MSASNQGYGQDVRTKASQLIDRMGTDPAFRDQIKADPVGALTAAGIPQDAVGDFLHEAGVPNEGEVAGYMMCARTCLDVSCVTSCYARTATF